jgi:mannose-6-phosphate isomerase-like protein (cupin superfamily)
MPVKKAKTRSAPKKAAKNSPPKPIVTKPVIRKDDGKYGKYIIEGPYIKFYQTDSFTVGPETLGCDCVITSQGFNKPVMGVGKEPHKHDFHQILCFVGGDPNNIHDFGAEIEVCLGEEMEKHLITTNAAITIPPGVYHCPINFLKVDKPVVFLEVMLVKKYKKETLEEAKKTAAKKTAAKKKVKKTVKK